MPPLDRAAFDGKDLEPIFIGLTMKDCFAAERVLEAMALEYAVEVESIDSGPFSSRRSGAVFYVVVAQAAFCRQQLHTAGLSPGVIDDSGLSSE